MLSSSFLDGLRDKRFSSRIVATFRGVASRICSRQLVASLCSSLLVFSCISLASKWYIYTTTAGKKSDFILSEKSDFHMIDNLSIAVHRFIICILTSFSVDKILLSTWSSNYRGLPLKVEIVLFFCLFFFF